MRVSIVVDEAAYTNHMLFVSPNFIFIITEDMQKFVENYPEFKKLSNNVSKHVAIMSELAHVVDDRALMDISALEQEMACGSDHSTQVQSLSLALLLSSS